MPSPERNTENSITSLALQLVPVACLLRFTAILWLFRFPYTACHPMHRRPARAMPKARAMSKSLKKDICISFAFTLTFSHCVGKPPAVSVEVSRKKTLASSIEPSELKKQQVIRG